MELWPRDRNNRSALASFLSVDVSLLIPVPKFWLSKVVHKMTIEPRTRNKYNKTKICRGCSFETCVCIANRLFVQYYHRSITPPFLYRFVSSQTFSTLKLTHSLWFHLLSFSPIFKDASDYKLYLYQNLTKQDKYWPERFVFCSICTAAGRLLWAHQNSYALVLRVFWKTF